MIKRVLITGGSGGLGSAISRRFAQSGYQVILTHLLSEKEKANTFLKELEEINPSGHQAYTIDLTESSAIEQLAHSIAKDGGLDALVNSAGFTKFVDFSDLHALDDNLIDTIFKINVRVPIAMVRYFEPLLKQTSNPCIINITSVAAQIANGSNIAYCASKSALENITRSLARTLAPQIRVISVAPGLADTGFVKGLDEAWKKEQESSTPLGKLVEAEGIGEVVYLACEKMIYSTGTTLLVDCGRSVI